MRHPVEAPLFRSWFAVLTVLLAASQFLQAQDAPQPQRPPGLQQKPATPSAPSPSTPAPSSAPAQAAPAPGNSAKTEQVIPASAARHFHQGFSFESDGIVENAILEYQAAIKEYPDYFEAHYNLGGIYLDRHGYAEAITELKAAVRDVFPMVRRYPLAHDAAGDRHELQIKIFDAQRVDSLPHQFDEIVATGSSNKIFIIRH